MLDPGGFGAVTITKSITINGGGVIGSITAALVNGVIINAPAGSVVTLRNLAINGVGSGLNGIRIISASQVTIEQVDIQGFTQSDIDINPSITAMFVISNCHLRASTNAVRVLPAAAVRVDVSIDSTTMKGNSNGVSVTGGTAFVNVTNSNITDNPTNGVIVNSGALNVDSSMLSSNGNGANGAGGTLRLSNNGIYDNVTGVICGAATVQSSGDNRVAGNTAAGCAPAGTIPTI